MLDPRCQALAARYIRRQAKLLAEQLDGVRQAADVEFVHRARVATRRLRAALRMFSDCFKRKQVKRWQKAIRRTTSKLGDARDRDVQIDLLCGALSALSAKECFPGIARILVQLERDREQLQRQVVKVVDRLEAGDELREMRRAAKRALKAAATPTESLAAPVACDATRRHIAFQLEELLRHQNSLADEANCREHHAMRIAAKRLRYSLEIARPMLPGQLDEAVEAVKRVQTLLGDVHDCDVWAEHLDAFQSQERRRIVALFGHAGRLARLQAGIDYLRDDRRGNRRKLFEQLVKFWDDLGRRQLWQRLNAVLEACDAVPGGTISPQLPAAAATAPAESGPGNGNGDALDTPGQPLLTTGS